MIRILITPNIIELAKKFAHTLAQEYNAKQRLSELRDALNANYEYAYRNYVDFMIQKYDEIICAVPNKFDSLNPQAVLHSDNFNYDRLILPKQGATKRIKFYKAVVNALGYDWVRSNLYPVYAQKLGIKTCVYCNGQYGVSIRKQDRQYTSSYQIDHFKPKSKFPYLATSFFNLQPSCSHCNSQKSTSSVKFNLYTSDQNLLRPFRIYISPSSITRFLLTHDYNELQLELKSSDKLLLTNHEYHFHVSDKYKNHKDEAADLIIISMYYNKTYLNQINKQFGGFMPEFSSHFRDVVLGFPTSADKVHKRPLTLMKQDIAKMLGLL